MMEFIDRMRTLSGGKPVGFKLCVGSPVEMAGMILAMKKCSDAGIAPPDFITVDGGEGGTGAAPPEFSNHVGTPLVEGVALINGLLQKVGLRDEVKIIASGKVVSGFRLVRNLALGADLCNSARGMMFALGCVQALKVRAVVVKARAATSLSLCVSCAQCNTNQCPTGVATQNPELAAGLVPESKAVCVMRFQEKTVKVAREIIGAAGLRDPSDISPHMIMVRTDGSHVQTLHEKYYGSEQQAYLDLMLEKGASYLRK